MLQFLANILYFLGKFSDANQEIFDEGGSGSTSDPNAWWVRSADAIEGLKIAMIGLVSMVATAGVIYVIVLVVNYIKAEDKGKQSECMKRLVNAIVGFVITIVAVVLFILLLDNIEPIATWINNLLGDGTGFSKS